MADDDTPRGRIAAAIAGKPKKAYARVLATDVAAVGGTIAADDHTTITRDLTAGAQRAVDERVAAVDPETIEVFQIAGQLAQLLEKAGAEPVPEGP